MINNWHGGRPAWQSRSEIRESDISTLSSRVSKRGYHQYLLGIEFGKLRGFVDQQITFDFPVTAIIGPNGGGKTTILSAAALIHRKIKTTQVFPRSGIYDEGMQGWKMIYRLLDGRQGTVVERSATYSKQRWVRGDGVARPIQVFGVERTVPASERKAFFRFMGSTFSAIRETAMSDDVTVEVNRILAKDSAEYRQIYAEDGGGCMLAGKGVGGGWYSEFHFGAGEASIVRMVSGIEAAPKESLILIEEIENGLHPLATAGLVEYLVKVARRKGCQVVFTTHSNDALEHLPPNAIWLAYNGKIVQGKLDVRMLHTLTGRSSVKLIAFVEDRFGEVMVRTALRCWTSANVHIPSVQICAVGGAGEALGMHRYHEATPTFPHRSVCILDGDQRARCGETPYVVALPGRGGPEQYVFDVVFARIDELLGDLTRTLQLPISRMSHVRRAVQVTASRNRDRHLIFEQIAEELDYLPDHVVEGAFLSLWAQHHPEDVEEILQPIADRLPLVRR